MNDEFLSALGVEIERQNAAFAEVKAALSALGDREFAVPQTLLDELDELCTPRPRAVTTTIFGLRA
jgi:hypothetical protein